MYLDYWQLGSQPFEPGSDRSIYFPSESHEAARVKLRYAVENRRGAVLLAGPTGVGKTMLVQLFREELGGSFTPQAQVVFPQMSSRDLLAYIADTLGAPAVESPRHSIDESIRRIEGVLRRNAEQEKHALLVIDEAHLLEDCGALETLRLLLNFEHSGKPMMTLVLIGQMNLISTVGRLPSLDERIAVKALVRSFTAEETAEYVRHRMTAAGATRDLFTPDALEALHYLGHGVARQINRLGDLALLVGYAEQLPQLTAKQVEAVSEELVTIAAE